MKHSITQKPNLVVVLGPTAVGKSALGVMLAKQYDGEIVSADSRQIYRHLDIGSGKVTPEEMDGIPHHLIDYVNPGDSFSVATYKKAAEEAISLILERRHLPIVVGGTGFYIQALVDGMVPPAVAPNSTLRAQLEERTTEDLFTTLVKKDPRRAGEIDPQNRRRIIRALEILSVTEKIPPVQTVERYTTCQVGLLLPDAILKERIFARTQKRLAAGLVEEMESLHRAGYSYEELAKLGFDQRYVIDYIQGTLTRLELAERIANANWQYAKRQMTWFKRDSRITWFSPDDLEQIGEHIEHFLGGSTRT